MRSWLRQTHRAGSTSGTLHDQVSVIKSWPLCCCGVDLCLRIASCLRATRWPEGHEMVWGSWDGLRAMRWSEGYEIVLKGKLTGERVRVDLDHCVHGEIEFSLTAKDKEKKKAKGYFKRVKNLARTCFGNLLFLSHPLLEPSQSTSVYYWYYIHIKKQ